MAVNQRNQRGQSRLNSRSWQRRVPGIQTTLTLLILRPLIGAILVGCGAASADDRASPEIGVELMRTPQAVEVRGLHRAAVRRLERLTPNDSTWSGLVAVYVDHGSADSGQTPAVIGRYAVSGDLVRFEPRFPFAEGVGYVVVVDTAGLRTDGPALRLAPRRGVLSHRFTLPSVARPRTTRVTGVHP